jgi:hypothetical protein
MKEFLIFLKVTKGNFENLWNLIETKEKQMKGPDFDFEGKGDERFVLNVY